MIGQTLAQYRITAAIGAGGMGEVYRATDTRLGRDVAIKVLPEEFFEDSDRVARFEREAKSLAALNHPGIAAVRGEVRSRGRHVAVSLPRDRRGDSTVHGFPSFDSVKTRVGLRRAGILALSR